MTEFEKKVRSMKPSEIIMAMVEGLRNPVTKIRMSTYGSIKNGVCYGCAATNAICKIGNFELSDLSVDEYLNLNFKDISSYTDSFLANFEYAINELRDGSIGSCNSIFSNLELKKIKDSDDIELPFLDDYYTEQDLEAYAKLAEYNASLGN